MKDNLNVGAFKELAGPEAEMVGGGGLVSNILDNIQLGISTIARPIPIIGNIVSSISGMVVRGVEVIATPIYGLFGLKYK